MAGLRDPRRDGEASWAGTPGAALMNTLNMKRYQDYNRAGVEVVMRAGLWGEGHITANHLFTER